MNEVLHHYHEQKTVSLLTDPEDLVENFGWGWGQGCEIGPAPLSQQGAEQVPGRGGKNPSAGLDLLSDASRGWKETGKGSKPLSKRCGAVSPGHPKSDGARGQVLGRH